MDLDLLIRELEEQIETIDITKTSGMMLHSQMSAEVNIIKSAIEVMHRYYEPEEELQ